MYSLNLISLILFTIINLVVSEYKTYYMDRYCNKKNDELDLPNSYLDSVIMLKATNGTYQHQLNCDMSLDVPTGYGVLVAVHDMHLHTGDRLSISIGTDVRKSWISETLVLNQSEYVETMENDPEVRISFQTVTTSNHSGFTFYITTFKFGNCSYVPPNLLESTLNFDVQEDEKDEFFTSCGDNKCVSYLLLCDKINNCGDWQDEQNCDDKNTNAQKGAAAAGAGGSSIVGAYLLKKVYNGRKKKETPKKKKDDDDEATKKKSKAKQKGKTDEKSDVKDELEKKGDVETGHAGPTEQNSEPKRADKSFEPDKANERFEPESGAKYHYKKTDTFEMVTNLIKFNGDDPGYKVIPNQQV